MCSAAHSVVHVLQSNHAGIDAASPPAAATATSTGPAHLQPGQQAVHQPASRRREEGWSNSCCLLHWGVRAVRLPAHIGCVGQQHRPGGSPVAKEAGADACPRLGTCGTSGLQVVSGEKAAQLVSVRSPVGHGWSSTARRESSCIMQPCADAAHCCLLGASRQPPTCTRSTSDLMLPRLRS